MINQTATISDSQTDERIKAVANYILLHYPQYANEELVPYWCDNLHQIYDENGQPDDEFLQDILHRARMEYAVRYAQMNLPQKYQDFLYILGTQVDRVYNQNGVLQRDLLLAVLKEAEKNQIRQDEEIIQGVASRRIISFNKTVGEDENAELQDLVEDLSELTPDRFVEENENLAQEMNRLGVSAESWEEVKDAVGYLKLKEKNRLLACILLSEYELLNQAAKDPSSMRPAMREVIEKFSAVRYQGEKVPNRHIKLVPERKAEILRQYVAGFGFWQYLFSLYRKSVGYHNEKQFLQLYSQYKRAFDKRPADQLESLRDKLLAHISLPQLQQEIKQAFGLIRFHKQIDKFPFELLHDQMMRRTRVALCRPEYEPFRFVLTKIALRVELTAEEEKYRLHVAKCNQCRLALEGIQEAVSHRQNQLIQAVRNHWGRYTHHHFDKLRTNQTRKQEPVSYYQKEFKQYPSEINALLLQVASRIQPVTGKKQVAAGAADLLPSRVPGADYQLSVRCICGAENLYLLNHYAAHVVSFGRLDDEQSGHNAINVCEDDVPRISRSQCYFLYKTNVGWTIQAGHIPSDMPDRAKAAKAQIMYYLPLASLTSWLHKILEHKGALKKAQYEQACRKLMQVMKPFPLDGVCLDQMAAVGICPADDTLAFRQKKQTGIFHPLLGVIPYGWWIEILHPRAEKDTLNSLINHSHIEQSTIYQQTCTVLSNKKKNKISKK